MFGLIILLEELVVVVAGADDWIDENDDSGDKGLSGAGGGSIGEARPSRMAFFSAATS